MDRAKGGASVLFSRRVVRPSLRSDVSFLGVGAHRPSTLIGSLGESS